jgi:cell division protein ZapA
MMKGVSVEIMGQNLTVASDENDAWVKSVAEAVDERIRKLRANGNTVSSVNIAILAALNFADELEHLKREHQELIDRITAMKERLIDAIDGKLVLEQVDARSQKGPAAG